MTAHIEVVRGIYIDRELYHHFLEHMREGELVRMFESLRRPPSRYYVRVNTTLIEPPTLVARLRGRGLEAHLDEYLDEAVWFPVKGPFKVPDVGRYVVADKYAAESVYMGANLYVPGIVRADGVRRGSEVTVLAPNGMAVAYGVAELDAEEMHIRGSGIAVRVIKSMYEAPRVRDLPEYAEGLIYDQSYPSMWVGAVTAKYSDGARIIVDMNAAPGGKLTHVAQLFPGPHIIGFDRPSKHRQLRETLRRLRMDHRADIFLADSRLADSLMPRIAGRVDIVIVDPPCSNLGVRPKLYERKDMRDVMALASYQQQFLRTAMRMVRKGGIVAYSTCTLTELENELNVVSALLSSEGAHLLEADIPVAVGGWGLDEAARFHPHVQDTPGFFIAALTIR